jgi:hypothetical protein
VRERRRRDGENKRKKEKICVVGEREVERCEGEKIRAVCEN